MLVHEGVLLENLKMYLNNTIDDLTVTTNLNTHVPHVMQIFEKIVNSLIALNLRWDVTVIVWS